MLKFLSVSCAIGVGLGWAAIHASGAQVSAPAGRPRVAVVAELFTSEGCSSCPAADDVLTRLVGSQPVPGVEIIAVGEHVDYWDRLGWRDPFSSASFTARQSQYAARVFGSDRIYTPQIVVDGRSEHVGSDYGAVRRAIEKAAQQPKATVALAARAEDARLSVDIRVDAASDVPLHEAADIMVVVTEDRLVTHVQRGENGGRVLTHSAVVRSLTTVGALASERRTFSMTAALPLPREWKRDNLRVVVFIQEPQSRRMLGAESVMLAR